MKDFILTPEENSSLYLIRKAHKLSEALHLILPVLQDSSLGISFERLFKGKKSALVVFGPKKLLEKLKPVLDLLELEDYTNVDIKQVSAREGNPKAVPDLSDEEHFWLQLILWGKFHHQLRCILVSSDADKRKSLLTNLPKAFSNEQILESYKKRSFHQPKADCLLDKKGGNQQSLTIEQVKHFLLQPQQILPQSQASW